jgi:glycosyltransferase involved in cell wall biosynthesis
MTVSVLICTYNRHDLLDTAIRSIVEGCDEKPDELVVVNGGDERTDEVVNRYVRVGPVEVRLIKTVNVNLANSRNIGLAECRGDVVAMTDDDAEVFPDWIRRIRETFSRNPGAGAVGGKVVGTNTDSLVGKVADAITFPGWDQARDVRTLPGVNIAYRREALVRIGPQDITLFRGEDVDFNWRVIQAGFTIRFDPVIGVYHTHRPTVKGFLNQHYMYGRAYVLVRRKWPEMYCIYPRGIHRLRDILKGGHFFVGAVYQPLLHMKRVPGTLDCLRALPLLYSAALAWRWGMIRQGMAS